MAEQTGIEWCDATFNPWWGCEKVSPGCAHCYADTLARRRAPKLEVLRLQIERKPYRELTKDFQNTIIEATEIIRAALVASAGQTQETK